MGFPRRNIGLSFFLQSVFIGVIGSCCGIIFAGLILRFRDGILSAFVVAFGRGDRLLSFYAFDRLPMLWRWTETAKICLTALAVAAIAGIVPALRAMAMDPSIALRHGE
jgi:ABC-type lipoprotein release transport system permease subunit